MRLITSRSCLRVISEDFRKTFDKKNKNIKQGLFIRRCYYAAVDANSLLKCLNNKYSYSRSRCKRIESSRFFSLTLSMPSSTVKVLDGRTVPRVVKHRIAGFRLLAKSNAAFALSATRATCSGFRVALDAGGQSLASAPRVRPSSSFRTATKNIISAQAPKSVSHAGLARVKINNSIIAKSFVSS